MTQREKFDMYNEAMALVGDGSNIEYTRGVCEFIAMLDGRPGVDIGKRAREVARRLCVKEVNIVKMYNNSYTPCVLEEYESYDLTPEQIDGARHMLYYCEECNAFHVNYESVEDFRKYVNDPKTTHISSSMASEENPEEPLIEAILDTGLEYNANSMAQLKPGMYLGLFHGRKDPNDPMKDGWGFNGPILGPLKWCHTTYASEVKLCPVGHVDGFALPVKGDVLRYKGLYYGDWSVFTIAP